MMEQYYTLVKSKTDSYRILCLSETISSCIGITVLYAQNLDLRFQIKSAFVLLL